MKILVFIKQIPDGEHVRIDPKTGALKREGMRAILNPNDAVAIEAALRLKEEAGGTVTAITMGPPQAAEILDRALAMGCDASVLLSDPAFSRADTIATGYTLYRAAETIGAYDVLLFGKCAADAETAQTGPIVAEFAELPQIVQVTEMHEESGCLICTRETEEAVERVRVSLPAVVAVSEHAFVPRYMKPSLIRHISERPQFVWDKNAIAADPARIGEKGSPSVSRGLFEPGKKETKTAYLAGSAEEMAKELVDFLLRERIL